MRKTILGIALVTASCLATPDQDREWATHVKCELQTAGAYTLTPLVWQQGSTPLVSLDQFRSGKALAATNTVTAVMRFGPSATNDYYVTVTNYAVSGNGYIVQLPTIGTNSAAGNWWYTAYFYRGSYLYWTGNGRLQIIETTSNDDGLTWQDVSTYSAIKDGWTNRTITINGATGSLQSNLTFTVTADTSGLVANLNGASTNQTLVTPSITTGTVDGQAMIGAETVTNIVTAATNGVLKVESDTLATVAARGGFAGTETIAPLSVNSQRFGADAGLLANGTGWSAFGFTAGGYASGTNWTAFGYTSGLYASGNNWGAYGYSAGVLTSGDNWMALGNWSAQSAIFTNSIALGSYSGRNGRGNQSLFIDNYATDPGVGHNPTNDMIFGNNGQLNIGRTGALTNAIPNVLRGRWIGNGSELTGITAAQVGAYSATNPDGFVDASITNGLASVSSFPGSGCTYLGATNGPTITGATVSYLAYPTTAYTLSVSATAPRYCYAIEILATNACTLGTGLTLRGTWTPTGTNILTLVPCTGTLWRVYGRGL